MSQRALPILSPTYAASARVKEQTYCGAVSAKLVGDKITLAAIALLVFMVAGALAAPWLASAVLGFDPLDTDLRQRAAPPTWAAAAWSKFQEFSEACRAGGCPWSIGGEILSSAVAGVGDCLAAGRGQCHWMGTDQAGRDVL